MAEKRYIAVFDGGGKGSTSQGTEVASGSRRRQGNGMSLDPPEENVAMRTHRLYSPVRSISDFQATEIQE